MSRIALSPQQSQVYAAIVQFPDLTIEQLARATLIDASTFRRRVPELLLARRISKDTGGRYHAVAPAPKQARFMLWHHVNAMVFESATHRVRRAGDHWHAERKAQGVEPSIDLGGSFEDQHLAQEACEVDAYALASGG